jgi:hypothetical protein
MAHYAGLIAAGVYPNPLPHADVVTSTTHKSLRGPRGGIVLTNDEGIAKKINSAIFPGIQGGPLMHVIAGKAVAFKEALAPEFKLYQQQVVTNARVLAETVGQQLGQTSVIENRAGGVRQHAPVHDRNGRAHAVAAAEEAGAVRLHFRLADGLTLDDGEVTGPELSLSRRALAPRGEDEPDIGHVFGFDEQFGKGGVRHVIGLRRECKFGV